jgi:hypothetical protein
VLDALERQTQGRSTARAGFVEPDLLALPQV